jgi:predicted RNase H-like HicB family nuclease
MTVAGAPRSRIEAATMVEKLRQVIYPGEDGFWVAECPSLPGCISQGQTRTEAITNIREAIEAYVAAVEADGIEWSSR